MRRARDLHTIADGPPSDTLLDSMMTTDSCDRRTARAKAAGAIKQARGVGR